MPPVNNISSKSGSIDNGVDLQQPTSPPRKKTRLTAKTLRVHTKALGDNSDNAATKAVEASRVRVQVL